MFKENFVERYIELKEKHLTDVEIADKMDISPRSLTHLKSVNGLTDYPKRNPKNSVGLTEEEFKQGIENGLTRRIMLRRVRDYDWSRRDAITKPKGYRFDCGRVVKR